MPQASSQVVGAEGGGNRQQVGGAASSSDRPMMLRAESPGTKSMAEDADAQTEWLNREARMRGFADIDALAEQKPDVFMKLAEKWREQNPAQALMSRSPLQGVAPSLAQPADSDYGARTVGHSGPVLSAFRNDQPLKENPNYKAAKGGDLGSAARLVQELVKPELIEKAGKTFGSDVVYLPVHAEESSGRKKIPAALAEYLSIKTNSGVDRTIVQAGRAYHTGAKAMERMMARAEFAGDVQPGVRYVLVDDVTTMGSTLADLAHYIRSHGGTVAGSVVLTNAMRGETIEPDARLIKELEARHGQAIRDILGIEPGALTAAEAQYLIGFRSTDELRNRVAASGQERRARLLSKGVSPDQGVAFSRAQTADKAQADPDPAKRGQQIIDTPVVTVALVEQLAQPRRRAGSSHRAYRTPLRLKSLGVR
ncbi:MAG: phosphoribosyltransferase [Betaproteobacteria bacterium]|nr:phosphoribosyltransferase [Betaproteobacteria bacterium]